MLGVLSAARIGRAALVCAVASLVLGGGSASARAEASAADSTYRALPGIDPGGAAAREPGWALAFGTGYGFTEAVLDRGDHHHRGLATTALAYRPSARFALSATFDARYDRHFGEGVDERGYVGHPRVAARAVGARAGPVTFGLEGSLWLPGENAPSIVPSAATAEIRGLGSYALGREALLYASAGVRIDRSAASAPDADRLSDAHRLALGVSESDAIVVGAGVRRALSAATVFGEWSWDAHVGSDAPALRYAPMRASAGVSGRLGGAYGFFATATASLSARPPLAAGEALVPVEPRARAVAGVTYRFGSGRADASAPEPRAGAIAGELATEDRDIPEGARVQVYAGSEARAVDVGGDGAFRVDGIPAGPARVVASAPGHREATAEAEIEPGATARLGLELEPGAPGGELQGAVLSYRGEPVAARIEIAKLDPDPGEDPEVAVLTADARGRFAERVGPGEYEVSIRAPGHRDQTRRVSVESGGVTILNVDLREER